MIYLNMYFYFLIFNISRPKYIGGFFFHSRNMRFKWNIYYQADGYRSTGCIDLNCIGFVPVNYAPITPGDSLEGQNKISIKILKVQNRSYFLHRCQISLFFFSRTCLGKPQVFHWEVAWVCYNLGCKFHFFWVIGSTQNLIK